MAESRGLADRWGVIGHDWAVHALDHAVSTGRASHAFLLTGPHGIGKTTLARALARRLNCPNTEPPCGVCIACRKTEKETNPDVRIVQGVPPNWKFDSDGRAAPPRQSERERRTLRIEQMRTDVEEWLALAPFESKYKIAILRRFEEANEQASNAFLKTLEEPPSHAFLILTAQDANLLLPTIVSRCQRLPLRPLPIETVERALVDRWHMPSDQARFLAHVSGGRLGWAVRAGADPKQLEHRRAALDALDSLVHEGRAERITRAGDLAKPPEEIPQMLESWLTWWRDLLLIKSGETARVTNVDREASLRTHAAGFTAGDIQAALKATRAAARQLEQNANARLVMEVLSLSLPHSV